MSPLFPTTLVGSYPQPEWLIDRKKLAGRFPPRVRAKELWRIPEPFLIEAQNDATVLAIRAQEAAGLDMRRRQHITVFECKFGCAHVALVNEPIHLYRVELRIIPPKFMTIV